MAPYAWSLNGEFWPNITPLMVATGQRVAIEMVTNTAPIALEFLKRAGTSTVTR